MWYIIAFILLLLIVLLLKKRTQATTQPRLPNTQTIATPLKARLHHSPPTQIKKNNEKYPHKKQNDNPSPPEQQLALSHVFTAEALINQALNQDPTQYALYLDLLDLHLTQHDTLAIQQLLNHIETLAQPQLLQQALEKQKNNNPARHTQRPKQALEKQKNNHAAQYMQRLQQTLEPRKDNHAAQHMQRLQQALEEKKDNHAAQHTQLPTTPLLALTPQLTVPLATSKLETPSESKTETETETETEASHADLAPIEYVMFESSLLETARHEHSAVENQRIDKNSKAPPSIECSPDFKQLESDLQLEPQEQHNHQVLKPADQQHAGLEFELSALDLTNWQTPAAVRTATEGMDNALMIEFDHDDNSAQTLPHPHSDPHLHPVKQVQAIEPYLDRNSRDQEKSIDFEIIPDPTQVKPKH